MKTTIWPLLLLLAIANNVNCAKILGVFTIPGRSHYLLGSTLMKALAEKGHDVTMISAFGEKESPKYKGTYRDIIITELLENIHEVQKEQNSQVFDRDNMNPFIASIFFAYGLQKMMEPALRNVDVQKLIHSNETFDLVIVEETPNDAEKALATHFKAPLIVMSSVGANFYVNSQSGNPQLPSYVPMIFVDYDVPMTFCERLINTLLLGFNEVLYRVYVYPQQNERIKKYIPNGPDLNDVLYNASIYLMNSHPSTNQPVPYVPNMIDIGGFHIKPPKQLPPDLHDFLNEAKDGVIYFSMGSNLKSADFPPKKRDAILRAFSKLKQKVLWKWEEDVLPGQPTNVKLSKWLPQQDILAHPNVKLFITHGGFSSTTETVYHGVPVLAIPIFGDQKVNAKVAVKNGFGVVLPYSEITEETFSRSIQEVLNNPKYKINAKKRSDMFHDRLVSPMETAIYWIEYVIRHKGAPHLRVAALDLPWHKYHLLDVIGFIALILSSFVVIFYYTLKILCKKLCFKKETKKLKKT